ncbi:MAG: carbohydrate ABC transporter permease [Actinobacteria bacterium]|nr:carbohydrate ABC transporter permease [Actinomycetota bacterium]MBW3650291.1 carbohydrate ABC transporter permease [Actinomycetota bacterium]
MSIQAPPPPVAVDEETTTGKRVTPEPVGARTHRVLTSVPTAVLWALVILWTIPTFGLLVNSLRPGAQQFTSGWWQTFADPTLTTDNYHRALFEPPGGSLPFWKALLNSFAIAIPGTAVPIAIAAAAAYAFAWMDFKGRHWLFIGVLAMMAVPVQMALVPLQQLYSNGAHLTLAGTTYIVFPDLDLNNKPIAVWLAHTAFGLPLAIYLLHNYIASLPGDVFEAARIDGATHFGIFWRIVLPLAKPAIAAFAIFQFLWVWNDYLVALIFLSQNKAASPLTVQLVNLVTSRGQGTELLPAAAFISMVVPLVIFFSLQRYFVRGLLAGSVKG